MSIHKESAEQLAELCHHYHRGLGADSGCRTDQAERWSNVSRKLSARHRVERTNYRVPGWTTDLRKDENRLDLAILLKF